MEKVLKLNHLYSKNLNIYGDMGNIIALKYWAAKMQIQLEVFSTEIGDGFREADIYFIGGGQDNDQILVYQDLLKHKEIVASEVNRNKVFLLICGGYQLFGKYFVDGEGNRMEGLGILDMETKSLNTQTESRCIGNVVVEMNKDFIERWKIDTAFSTYLVGFENHGGQTRFLSKEFEPIGKAVAGFGNNSHEKLEGCSYKNLLGSYLHGSLLPKNPHLAISLLKTAAQQDEKFQADLSLEKQAHTEMLKRFKIAGFK